MDKLPRIMIRLGGILLLALGVLQVLKPILTILESGFFLLSPILLLYRSILSPIYVGISPLGDRFILPLLMGVLLVYLGYKLYEMSERSHITISVRKKWMVILLITFILLTLLNMNIIAIIMIIPLMGLVLSM